MALIVCPIENVLHTHFHVQYASANGLIAKENAVWHNRNTNRREHVLRECFFYIHIYFLAQIKGIQCETNFPSQLTAAPGRLELTNSRLFLKIVCDVCDEANKNFKSAVLKLNFREKHH